MCTYVRMIPLAYTVTGIQCTYIHFQGTTFHGFDGSKGHTQIFLQKYVALLYNWSVVFIVTFTVSVSATTDYVWLQINFQSTTPSMCSHFTLEKSSAMRQSWKLSKRQSVNNVMPTLLVQCHFLDPPALCFLHYNSVKSIKRQEGSCNSSAKRM